MFWYIIGIFAFFWFITAIIAEIYNGWVALSMWIVLFGWLFITDWSKHE